MGEEARDVRGFSATGWGLRSLSPPRGPRDPQVQVPAQFLSRPRAVVFSSGHTGLSVLRFTGVYYFDEGSCGLELRAQLLFYFVFIFVIGILPALDVWLRPEAECSFFYSGTRKIVGASWTSLVA